MQLSLPNGARDLPESTDAVVSSTVWDSISSHDALAYLVPDAAPVGRFVERYAAANYGFSVVTDTASDVDFAIRDEPQ